MAASQRIVPLLVASTVGIFSGIYIFDPILRQYMGDKDKSPVPMPGDAQKSTAEKVKEAATTKNDSTTESIASKAADAFKDTKDTVSGNATDQRLKAVASAGQRAADAAKDRAEKTGDGKVV